MGILSGYRVVDLSIAMAGPFAAMRLGDLGADVIKVEPVAGEWQRHTSAGGAAGRQVNASFLSLNRNKRSLAVNLKSAEGREIVLSLARRSDVFLQNYRPGVAERLGMDYESIRAARPDIVYVSISGFGETGPYADRPGQDMLLQAMSGAMFSVGRAADPPAPAGTFAVDAITAYSAFEGALAALLHRERTGEGQLVTVNMLDSAIAVQAQELSIFTVGGVPQHPGPRACLHPRALRHVRDRRRVHRAGLPQPGEARRGTRHPAVRRDGRRDRRPCPPGRDHRAGQCPPAGTHHGRVAGYFLETRPLGRTRLHLCRCHHRSASAAQRVHGQL